MAEQKNNIYAIAGVIYALPVRKADGKKGTINEGKTFEFPSVILEVTRQYKEKTYTELPEFELGYGVNIQGFGVGDEVEIVFSLYGKKMNDTWHKTGAKAIYIKHIDRDDSKTVGGESPREARRREKAEKDMFTPPNPLTDNEPEDDLPF